VITAEQVSLTVFPSPMVSSILLSFSIVLMAACVDWEMTVDMLNDLNKASLTRREVIAKREGGSNGQNPAVEQLKSE
jgi:3-deoxy-7-phosphoheptulonate synthase